MTERQAYEVSVLISRALEGALTAEQYAQLNELMADPAVQAQYFEQLKVDLALRDISTHEIKMEQDCDVALNPDFWLQLAQAEQEAPAVAPAVEVDEQREPVKKVEYETVRRVNKTSLLVAISSLAALLFLLIYLSNQTSGQIQMATVMDTYQAQWVGGGLAAGGRVALSSDPQILLEGMVKMVTDEGVNVVIEGPAKFRFTGTSNIEMDYGSLFARVNPSGIGFAVTTPVSRVIDLGTAFGVRADLGGDTELHVFEGRTSLSLNDGKSVGASNQFITRGQARQIDGRSMTVREIAPQTEAFVEDIDSRHGWIFRGQKALSLADMAGGGNGLGTGRRHDAGINPVTGQACSTGELNRWSGNDYILTPNYPFVDGVFVPNGTTDQVVSSRGDLFRACPPTQGCFYTEILNTPWIIDTAPLRVGETEYRANNRRGLFLHANLGITYDLDRIRRALAFSGQHLQAFETRAGISDAAWRDCNADIWVLVDGQVRYSRRHIQAKGAFETIRLELSEEDHFLTLVATDGGPSDPSLVEKDELDIDSDWCVFDEPMLILE